MEPILQSQPIVRMHDDTTSLWHDPSASTPAPTSDLLALAQSQHHANFDLWHEEDKARAPLASDAEITRVKHAIDALNQRRNDLVEQMDDLLLHNLSLNPSAPLHSETPGLMIDRLSILALKIFHTREEAHRASATQAHRDRNLARLALLEEQRSDLAASLDTLATELSTGQRRFKLYRQMKMYNDPELNPAVYLSRGS